MELNSHELVHVLQQVSGRIDVFKYCDAFVATDVHRIFLVKRVPCEMYVLLTQLPMKLIHCF